MDSAATNWTDFFVAEVGATAALEGLVIVAISINLKQILTYAHLPGRAVEALVLLLGAMTIASVALIPGQPSHLLGIEILAVQACVLLTSILQSAKSVRLQVAQKASWWIIRILVVASTSTPMLIGGIILARGDAAGLYWIAPGILLAIAASILNAWVLLIEILR
jgi:modulator of FtsH protease